MGPSGFRAAFLPQRSCACNFHDPRPTHSRSKCCVKKWSAVCFSHYSLFSEEENNYENVTTDRSRKFDRWRLPDVASPANAVFHGGHFHHSARVNTVRSESRQALRNDRADLNRDSATLHEDRQDGASHSQLTDDRNAIRQDQRAIDRDQRAIDRNRDRDRDDRREDLDDLE
jgi:hypothetical protein